MYVKQIDQKAALELAARGKELLQYREIGTIEECREAVRGNTETQL